jgi:hypothetical protein
LIFTFWDLPGLSSTLARQEPGRALEQGPGPELVQRQGRLEPEPGRARELRRPQGLAPERARVQERNRAREPVLGPRRSSGALSSWYRLSCRTRRRRGLRPQIVRREGSVS